jgi:Transcriptional regulator
MKDLIIDAAARLFTDKGYYCTSMEDVAKEAGVAKGSLYYHFKNKSQLFLETVLSGIDYFSEKIISIRDSGKTVPETAEKIIRLMVDIFEDNRIIADMVMTDTDAGIDFDTSEEIKAAKAKLICLIANVLDEGIGCGEIRQCDAQPTATASALYIYTYCRAKKPESSVDRDIMAKQIEDLLLCGLLK